MRRTHKRLGSLLLVMAMLLTMLPVSAMAAGDDAYSDLADAIAAAPTDETETVVTMTGDITGMTTDQIITIQEGQNIVLDMAGHSITVADGFAGRPIVNEGTLTVTGNGTIDASASEGGFGAINNKNTLTIENGTYRGAVYASGSGIRNTGATAVLVIEDGVFEEATCAVYNEGTATIKNGRFSNHSCSACAKADGHEGIYSYVIRNATADSKMTIDGGTFTGTQGAASAAVGSLTVNGGYFKTVDCDRNHGAIFYALYAAGEVGEVETVINGGTFETEGKITAVSIGNDNKNGDGGINAQAAAEIRGGTFKAPQGVPAVKRATETGQLSITGGTFSSDVSAYMDLSSNVTEDTNGNFVIIPNKEEDCVAEINGKYYKSLSDAITSAKNGDTVTLLKNVDLGNGYININKKLALDLNGYTISGTNTWVIGVYNDVTIKDSSNGRGKIVNSATSGSTIIAVLAQEKSPNDQICKLTIEGGVITATGIENSYGVFSNNSKTTYGPTIIVNGGEITGNFAGLTVTHDTDLTISGGEITGDYYAVSGNGTADDTNITINGGKLISKKGNAVYHPQVGNMTIGGNAELTGPNGIQYCGAGTLTIQDNAVITATGPHTEFPSKPSDQGDGSTDDGAALSIVSRGSGYQDGGQKMTVNITGGTLTSVNNAAISVYRLQNKSGWVTNDQTDLSSYLAALNVSGGKLSGDEHKGVFEIDGAAKETVIVSGGHFSEPVEVEYLNDSLNAELKSDSEPKTPYSYFVSMDDAIAAAKPGDVVTMIRTESTYTVTLNYNDGSAGSVACTVKGNTSIALPVPTRTGYNFLGWYDGSTKVSSTYQVTKSVTLVAQWSYIDNGGSYEPSGDHIVSVDKTVGGKVTVNPGRADKGDTVTITVKPDKGYELDSLIVTAKDGGAVKLTEKSANKFTFKMPGSKVTVEAVFVKEETKPVVTLPFADVNKGDWFYDAVEYVYGHDLMNGTSATTFSPFVTTSRAMILTILARYDGVDTSTGSTWYEAGAAWAIAEGVSDGTNLEANLTREQLVTMLWRYAGSPVVEGDLADYPDSASVSDWAVNAMIWAVENGVITGNGAGALNPQGTATRAEVATILMRFIEK